MSTTSAPLHVQLSRFIDEAAVQLSIILSYSTGIYVFHVQEQRRVVSLDPLLQWKKIVRIKERL
jgi:hypothetical protein